MQPMHVVYVAWTGHVLQRHSFAMLGREGVEHIPVASYDQNKLWDSDSWEVKLGPCETL